VSPEWEEGIPIAEQNVCEHETRNSIDMKKSARSLTSRLSGDKGEDVDPSDLRPLKEINFHDHLTLAVVKDDDHAIQVMKSDDTER